MHKAIESGGYTVCSNGLVLSKKGKELVGAICRLGYHRLCLTVKGKQFNAYAHRIIASKFIPNPDNLPEVNHIDSNKLNNDVSNLEWCTRSHNMKHLKYGSIERAKEVQEHILSLHKQGLSSRNIAAQVGVSKPTVLRYIKEYKDGKNS